MLIGVIDGKGVFPFLSILDECCPGPFDVVSVSSFVTIIRGTAAGLPGASMLCLLESIRIMTVIIMMTNKHFWGFLKICQYMFVY